MWFNNAVMFQFEMDKDVDLATLLEGESLKPCPPHARFIYGWAPATPYGLTHEIAGCSLISMGKEERILPRGVIQQLLAERIQAIEAQQGRTVKRSERSQMAEELEFELLPKSFCLQKRLTALFDHVTKRLIVNSASTTQAAQLTSLLRKSIPSLRLEPMQTEDNLAIRFASWINNPSLLPASFQLASDCLLISLEDEKKRFACKGYELPSEEILTLLSQGLAAAEISLIWNERIQFTLTQDLIFKRLKCMDYLIDEFNDASQLEGNDQQQDASLTILAGELRALTNDVFKALDTESCLPEYVMHKELQQEKPYA